MQNSAVFLFAHQDDEFGVYGEINRLINNGTKVIAIYLTSGSLDARPRLDRNKESVNVLQDMGVLQENIYFCGSNLQIADGKLYQALDKTYLELLSLLESIDAISALYFLAWEGGHQDHDAVHIIGLALAKQLKILDKSFQFTLYTGHGLAWIFFKLFAPLPSNGKIITFKIPLHLRLKFIKYVFSYRSQVTTWLGLFPFLLWHYIFRGTQMLQPVAIARVLEAPHVARLLYERRGVMQFQQLHKTVQPFINSRLL
jgi:hypothetical protein